MLLAWVHQCRWVQVVVSKVAQQVLVECQCLAQVALAQSARVGGFG